MLLSYKYRNSKGNHGWYQCEKEDFSQMFHNKSWQADVTWCKVKLADGRILMWTPKLQKWFEPQN